MTSKQRDELQKISAAFIMYPVGYGLQNLQCKMSLQEIKDIVDTILATPPRNCDMPLVVDGPADNNADKAWLVFKRQNPDAYFDVSGLLRCIDWLLAPATEKEGGEK